MRRSQRSRAARFGMGLERTERESAHMPMRLEMTPFRCRARARTGQGGETGAGEEARRGQLYC